MSQLSRRQSHLRASGGTCLPAYKPAYKACAVRERLRATSTDSQSGIYGEFARFCRFQQSVAEAQLAEGLSANAPMVMGKLVACLDLLEQRFSSEIDGDIARGVAA